MELILIVVAVVVVAAGVGVFLVMRSRAPKEEPLQHFKCPNCRRKLRYRPSQAGHKGMCPLCKQHIVFPAVAQGSSSDRKR
jgi:hypothetical protein